MNVPTLDEFLQLPVEAIASMENMPRSAMQSVTMTRRCAVLNGAAESGDAYARWCLDGWLHSAGMMFEHGIKHLFITQLHPTNYRENTPNYREHLARWVNSFMLSDIACEWYDKWQCRSHILYQEEMPEFQDLQKEFDRRTGHHQGPRMWNMFVTDAELPMRWMLNKLQGESPANPATAIQALYGEAVPLIDLYLGFGKPVMSPLPPFLLGKMQCYWAQFCAYTMTQESWRTILYDYLYTRATWREDKTERAKNIKKYEKAWNPGPTVGLGIRLGSYWYPQSTPPPPLPTEA